ncbi:uncharacterized protein LOC134769929 [Penaeus indicus]|uniref:uncharacterized protein LOC134769929 n=1 Tax=Penaeus indicus TaxID=29960 RepID=UPI00300C081E
MLLLAAVAVTLCASSAALAPGCQVSGRVTVPWDWFMVEGGAWVPHNSQKFAQLQVSFGGDPEASDFKDTLNLFTDSVILTEERESRQDYLVEYEEVVPEGWLSFGLEVAPDYRLYRKTKNGSQVQLFKRALALPVREVVISGSNITLGCDADWYAWRVDGGSVVVPLTPGGNQMVAVYSNRPFTPMLVLGGRNITVTAKQENALSPYTRHEFSIECSVATAGVRDNVVCGVKRNGEVLQRLEMPTLPGTVTLEGTGQPQYFFLQQPEPLVVVPSPSTRPVSPPPPPPATTPMTVGPAVGWSGWWAALAVILAILLGFVVVMCVISHYHRPKIQKYFEGFNRIVDLEEPEDVEGQPLMNQEPEVELRRPKLLRSTSIVNTEDPDTVLPLRLWNAVASGEQEEVEQVLVTLAPDPEKAVEGWTTSPYEEAHHRGHYYVLRTLEEFMEKEPEVPQSDLILSVMQTHTRNVESVFEAARGGQYRYGGGVDVLLRAHSLPGTLQDQFGYSLLHYAASVKLADGGPLWLAADIRSLVESHQVFVNAVDYKGRTALHALAEAASVSERNTCWDGKALSVNQAWVSMAALVLRLGCDPRVPDRRNHHPDQLARAAGNLMLAEELAKASQRLGAVNSTEKLSQFKDLAKAAKYGDVHTMQSLLMEAVPVLPLGARADPLLEAVQGGHRDAVFLLFSAGAPLCAQGLVGNTPFEVAHSTKGLPALFPALVRKAFSDKLQVEISQLACADQDEIDLKNGLDTLKTIAENSGHRLEEELRTWFHNSSSLNYTKLLAKAAGMGLTLTCQLLGVAGVRLNALPGEVPPLELALSRRHHDTAYALCRDLRMNPYATECEARDVSQRLVNDLLDSELMRFERKLQKTGIDKMTSENLMTYARSVKEKQQLREPTKNFLYLLAELSLVTILHRLRKQCPSLGIDTLVHEGVGATMLHVAAAYGKTNMVEYLLFQGASHTIRTYSGLTPVHFAATRGYKECMEYIINYTGEEPDLNHGLSPNDVLQDFAENIKNCHLDVLSKEEATAIASANGNHLRAKLMLAKRCEVLGIRSVQDIQEIIEKEQKIIETMNFSEIKSIIEKDVSVFLNEITQIDPRFSGKLVSFCSTSEKNEFFLPDDFEFYVELEDYHALQGGCITVIDKAGKEAKDGEEVFRLTSTRDADIFEVSRFKDSFYKAAQEALGKTAFKNLALVPPFFTHSLVGVSLFALYLGKPRATLVRVSVTPVIKVPVPHEHQWQHLPERLQNPQNEKGHEHLANTAEGTWIYLFNFMHEHIISSLKKEELIVLQTCVFFCKLLKAYWWLPKREQRRYGCVWQTSPLGVDVPSPRTLITLFLAELMEEGEEVLRKEVFVEKVISVLRRAPKPEKFSGSFKSSQRRHPIVVGEVRAIMFFLKGIQ